MAGKCSPPKGVTVRAYWRAAPRKHRSGPRSGQTYHVAENASGHTCGHHHRSFTSAHRCAASLNRKATRSSGRKAATYITDKRTAK